MSLSIGVDGGATKTELILVDATGAIVATHFAPGCNPTVGGPIRARGLITEALQALRVRHPAGTVARTLLCMSGPPPFWREFADGVTGYGRVVVTDDSQPVLELATAGKPGLVLHAGTGSFVAARGLDGVIHYAGGLGRKFGDPGSGYDLGRRGLGLALLELQALDGVAPLSPLAAALCAHTAIVDYAGNSRFFYNDMAVNAQLAAFAPRVLELAAQQDGPARQVVFDSISELARQADSVISRLFSTPPAKVPCGISGRILNSAPAAIALRSLADQLRWPVELRFLEQTPIEGVRRLLLSGSRPHEPEGIHSGS